jgi:hypothetical protein
MRPVLSPTVLSKTSLDWHAASPQGKPLCSLLLDQVTVFSPAGYLMTLLVQRLYSLWSQDDRQASVILTAMLMKASIFRDITLCSPLKVNRRFGRTCHFHLQSRRIIHQQAEIRADVSDIACRLLSIWFLAWLILRLWRWRRHDSPKRWLTFNGLHLRR